MTAHELARILLAGPDLPLQSEGCDCWGDVQSVIRENSWEGQPCLLLGRYEADSGRYDPEEPRRR